MPFQDPDFEHFTEFRGRKVTWKRPSDLTETPKFIDFDNLELENVKTFPEVVLEYGQATANSNIYKRNKRDKVDQAPDAVLQYLQPIEKKSMPSNIQSGLSKFAFFRGKKSQNIVVEDSWVCSPIQDVWN